MNKEQTQRDGLGISRKANGEVEIAYYDQNEPKNLVKTFYTKEEDHQEYIRIIDLNKTDADPDVEDSDGF